MAHCGTNVQGTFLNTFVLTDVATGWTECLPLLLRSQDEVLQALGRARQLLPFPLLGLDTDNGSEFLNNQLLEYCRREEITFTRGRPYRKNDQCFVEQKNGVLVRQMVGYDRYEGERAYRQLTELYRALRLYVNFFQPSMKLRQKERDGGHVTKRYDAAQTPYQRLESSGALVPPITARLADLALGLDPLGLLRQVEVLQDAFWRHAVTGAATSGEMVSAQGTEAAEALRSPVPATGSGAPTTGRRRYRHTGQAPVPHTWRTREDPFAAVWPALCERLTREPDLTAKELLIELLQEKRTALITRAVTKGLNPTVPMKDSGVDWLGQIPAHWEVKRIRDIAESLQTGPFGSQLHAHEYTTEGVPVIMPQDILEGSVSVAQIVRIPAARADELKRHRVRIGDLIFARRGDLSCRTSRRCRP